MIIRKHPGRNCRCMLQINQNISISCMFLHIVDIYPCSQQFIHGNSGKTNEARPVYHPASDPLGSPGRWQRAVRLVLPHISTGSFFYRTFVDDHFHKVSDFFKMFWYLFLRGAPRRGSATTFPSEKKSAELIKKINQVWLQYMHMFTYHSQNKGRDRVDCKKKKERQSA